MDKVREIFRDIGWAHSSSIPKDTFLRAKYFVLFTSCFF